MRLNTREDFAALFTERGLKISVEIGVRKGCFSEYLLKNMNPEMHFCIDPWGEALLEASTDVEEALARERLSKFANCTLFKMTSEEGAKKFDNNSVDFVYIDGCHTYDCVKQDIELWWPKIRTGGILSGHDFHEGDWPGIVKAVKEFSEASKLEINTTGIGSGYGDDGGDGQKESWWFNK